MDDHKTAELKDKILKYLISRDDIQTYLGPLHKHLNPKDISIEVFETFVEELKKTVQ